MLKELRCDIFREKIIRFHKGLNVILGDNLASNSIGKSTFLMILDFVFGGNTYVKVNYDVVENIGHHELKFCFDFSDEKFYFIRHTEKYRSVFCCDRNYNILNEISIDDYTDLLKKKYKIELPYLSFREITSPYSRIWGKNNYDLKKPLHQDVRQRNKEVVLTLIKLFNKYEGIKTFEEKLKDLEDKNKAVLAAIKNDFLPSLTKRGYQKNIENITDLKNQVENLKSDVLALSINLKELVTKEILNLKNEKSQLVKQKDVYENRLKRTQNNILRRNMSLQSQFVKLTEYFPNVNLKKLGEIEQFHNSISSILIHELRKIEKELLLKIRYLQEEIGKIDLLINEKLNVKDAPNYTVDRIVELTTKIQQMEYANSIYDKQQKILEEIKNAKNDLSDIKATVTSNITSLLNTKMVEINKKINTTGRRPPVIEVKDDTYMFLGFDDTGTGKAYTNLLTLDLAIFRLTPVPILIHDSLLFKNVENAAIENIIAIYNSEKKQVFIAIDEINKYSKETQAILSTQSVLSLSAEKTLFIKDWKKN
jgi:Uncharacterised protein conserved in bacteria (DUF2326)